MNTWWEGAGGLGFEVVRKKAFIPVPLAYLKALGELSSWLEVSLYSMYQVLTLG